MSKELTFNLERINELNKKFTKLDSLRRGDISHSLGKSLDACFKGVSVGVVSSITKLTSHWGVNSKGIRELVGYDAVDYKVPSSDRLLWKEFDDEYSVRNTIQSLQKAPLLKLPTADKKRAEMIHFVTELGKLQTFAFNKDALKSVYQLKTPVEIEVLGRAKETVDGLQLTTAYKDTTTLTHVTLFEGYELLKFHCKTAQGSNESEWSNELSGGYRSSQNALELISVVTDEDYQGILNFLEQPTQSISDILTKRDDFIKGLINQYGHYAVLANL